MLEVRVVLEVTDRSSDDSLELIIRGTTEGQNAVEAMKTVARGVEEEVNKRLGA